MEVLEVSRAPIRRIVGDELPMYTLGEGGGHGKQRANSR